MFKQVNTNQYVTFNSDASNKLLTSYNSFLHSRVQEEGMRPRSHTFAPSGIRCQRKSWFRLRGTAPDPVEYPDMTLDFTATVGTLLHQCIQSNLRELLKDDWISVPDYLKDNPIPYKYDIKVGEYETKVSINEPPVSFACDGIIRINGKIYLLEIKTSEYSSWSNLTEAKSHHIDQITTYGTLLGIRDVLFMYIDRQYGGIKVFEHNISALDSFNLLDMMTYVQDMVKKHIAPPRLPVGDYMCTNCEYQKSCKEWG